MNFNNPFETYTRGMTARERRIRTRWGLMFALTGIIAIALTFVVRSQKEDIKELNSQIEALSNERDELQHQMESEIFVRDTQLAREEHTLEILKKKYPECAEKYETTKSNYTE